MDYVSILYGFCMDYAWNSRNHHDRNKCDNNNNMNNDSNSDRVSNSNGSRDRNSNSNSNANNNRNSNLAHTPISGGRSSATRPWNSATRVCKASDSFLQKCLIGPGA